ncbi:hypothetical protein [Magnetospira sp. QH-2]|uniref:hypothetical protein n=1 Tax=Magnetospira sp. (strain QH-2) TaxID=1288970 RepID=UPI0003E819A6|nr:hypothetical protein [Magnetospira sp. QH-2]CCQ75584.1 protein of unknown function [Magnetospira sp. QH-2]
MMIRPTEGFETFDARLRGALVAGQPLGDLGNMSVVRAWLEICEGLPRSQLPTLIPDTIARLTADPDWQACLVDCGLGIAEARSHVELGMVVACYGRLRDAREEPEDSTDRVEAGYASLQRSFAALDSAARRLDSACADLDRQITTLEADLEDVAQQSETMAHAARAPKTMAA